jgi:hypothetical protein
MGERNFNSEMISNIRANKFENAGALKDCHEHLMERCAELLIEAKVEMIRQKEKCRRVEKHTEEDIRKALRFHNCLLCSLGAFFSLWCH